MDKTFVQTKADGSRVAAAPSRATAGSRVDGAATRSAILRAARDRLIEVGYANQNVRDIAQEAGVNHALIGYHFHGKQQLVLAVLDEANRQLLERQAQMYRGIASASKQWQEACDFYEEDLQSGFVCLLMELMGASFHDHELRAEFVPRILQWHRLMRPLRQEGQVEPRTEAEVTDAGGPKRAPKRLVLTAGSLPAPGSLPEPYPYESIAPVREGFVEQGGVETGYGQFGSAGPWLVFAPVHQIANAHLLKGVVPWLADHFRVVVMDLRGNGRSDRPVSPDQYSFEHYYGDFVAVLDRLEVGRAPVVAISATTMTALRLAAVQPARVSHLVVAGGFARWLADAPKVKAFVAEQLAQMRSDWPGMSIASSAWSSTNRTPPGLAKTALFSAVARPTARPWRWRSTVGSAPTLAKRRRRCAARRS